MIASTSFAAAHHLLGEKLCLHGITNLMGELPVSSLNRSTAAAKKRRTNFRAMSYDLGYKLPDSLGWLMTPQDKSKKPPLRRERMGGKWFGVILEWKGVIVEDDDPDLEPQVWYVLSQEEGKSYPPDSLLKKIDGMKTDQAISDVLCWSQDPLEIERLAARKEAIYRVLHGGYYRIRPGTIDFMNTLLSFSIPTVVVSTLSRQSLQEAIDAVDLQDYFDMTVAAEDVCRGKPEPEMFEVAAQRLGIEPDRCLVFGNSRLTIEAARNAGMRCVGIASRLPVYELQAADHVVRWLDQLSVVELQTLAGGDPIGRRARASHMEIVIED
ncbi:5-amino-6-(5-phospho-D-ribitylamino)uracil phosphatase, chloroplastic-like [Typha angustifolia]|uniref:5-amino-6-(5-phospho-D-ribitylamino)uracil phosphatase, chloroplastic-like n=1 Tax=Typha angustifolia TaxID=59011 RepID=UPI003C2ACAA2